MGRFGILEAGARSPERVRDRRDRFVLAHDPLVEAILHVDQLLGLSLEKPLDRNARPARDDRRDVVFVDLLLHHRCLCLLALGELPLELRQLSVANLRDPLEVALALGALCLHPQVIDPLRDLLDPVEGLLLLGPATCELVARLLRLGEGPFDGSPNLGLLLRHRRLLDLELAHAAVRFIKFDRRRVDLHPKARGGLVDQVDRLVG